MLRSRGSSMLQAAADFVSPDSVKISLKIEGDIHSNIVRTE